MSSEFIPFNKPAIGEEEIRSVVETLRSGWLTTGPKVKTFEAEFASYIGSSHAVAVNSATAALHLALEAVGIKSGDEVIVPTMTFTATAEVVLYLGARPVLVDCRTDDLNIDVDRIEAAISNNTKAIIPVHIAGRPCAMDQILAIAQRHGLRVIEDAAHALPASYLRQESRSHRGYYLLLLLCNQDDHDRRGRNGYNRQSGVGQTDEDDEPSWD